MAKSQVRKQQPTSTQTSTKYIPVGGIVVDDENLEIEGVSVSAKNKDGTAGKATTTDSEGHYSFQTVDPCGTLTFTASGFVDQTKRINKKELVNVQMLADLPENMALSRVKDKYENIALYVTGNSADNERTDKCCSIPIPPLNEKILQRLPEKN